MPLQVMQRAACYCRIKSAAAAGQASSDPRGEREQWGWQQAQPTAQGRRTVRVGTQRTCVQSVTHGHLQGAVRTAQ